MRKFNVEGPCDPQLHFMVRRETLIRHGLEKIRESKFFTIFAPRQAGKTTYFLELLREVERNGDLHLVPIWVTVEGLGYTGDDFLRYFKIRLHDRTKDQQVQKIIAQFELKQFADFDPLMRAIYQNTQKRIVLVIDEFDDIPDDRISEIMHIFRSLYHERDVHALHSLALVGVRNISGVVLDRASPFNIADEIEVPYFNRSEVEGMIGQYETESGQKFDKKVVAKIYENTLGQPGLVNALCRELVEKFCPNRKKPVNVAGFRNAMNYFLTERIDRNISNIINKANEQKDFMMKVLFDENEIPFRIYDARIKFLSTHGVIAKNQDGMVDIPIPLYKNALIVAFRPLINGETTYYVSPSERFEDFYKENDLYLDKIIRHYIQYIHRRGFRAFDTENLQESACHYSFDAFINFFIERLGGKVYMEVPSGRGRIDTLILYQNKSYLIEIKRWTDPAYYQKGKRQLAEYAKSEGLSEGYYVVFSSRHTENDTLYEQDDLNGVKIRTYVIRRNFEQASSV